MTFRVGQKVVCINGEWNHDSLNHPRKGDVCTIANIYDPTRPPPYLQCSYLGLVEFPVAHYAGDYFRPVVERKTDISVFLAMLNPSQVTVDAMNTADFARENAG